MRKFLILSIICFVSVVFAFSNIGFNLSEIEKIQFMNEDIDRVQIGNSVVYESSNTPIIVYSPATDFNFTTNTSLNLIIITGYKGTGGQVNIPPEINSYPVKNIANSAFSSKSTITGVIVPDSVTNIEASCFNSCSSMTNIILSSNLKTLGGSTFNYCSKLERIDFPDELTTINELFTSCSKLKEITFGSKMKDIVFNAGEKWPYCTLLSNIVVSSSNPYYASDDGVLLNSNKTEIIVCGQGKMGVFNMPSTVTNVLHDSFYYSSLSEINFSKNLIGIGQKAFVYSKLKQVILPDSLTYIYPGDYSGYGAFQSCSSITNVVTGSGLKNIPYKTFYGASNLRYLTLNESITNVGYSAFGECSLTNFILPSSLVKIDYGAFFNNKFSEISIPNSVKFIGDQAFASCANLTNIMIGSGLTTINPASAFASCDKLLNIEVSTENADYASYDGYLANKDLTSAIYYPLGKDSNIIFPEGMKIILSSFAMNHYKIRGVDFPTTITNIEDGAFNNDVGLTNIIFREGLVGIGKNSFYNNKAYNIRLPDSLTYLGDYAFSSSSMTNLTIGSSLKVVPYYAFYNCSGLKTVTLGNSLEVLGTNCFYNCQSLKDVLIPDSVKDIYPRAFYSCYTLTNVNIGAGLTNIGVEAFNSTGITNFIVSAENQSYTCIDSVIYDKAVKNLCICASKRGGDIIIPDGVTNVLESAASYCYNVKNVVFPDSLARLGLYAFWGDTASGYYFKGNAPSYSSSSIFSAGMIYRLDAATGWPVVPNTFLNRPTAIWTAYPDPIP